MNVYIGARLPGRVEDTGEIAAAIALADHVQSDTKKHTMDHTQWMKT
jgi:hypothetical protein